MGERLLRNILIFGTLFFFVILFGMTMNSLAQVTSERTPGVTDQIVAGKQVWQARNCSDCHTILGIGGYFAPNLPQINQWTHSTRVTASHGYLASFGAFGMLVLAAIYYMLPQRPWSSGRYFSRRPK
jgi:nitric oxide reductase large subunit